MPAKSSVIDLPTDLFLMVSDLLSPFDIIHCRLVSRSWHEGFTADAFLRTFLRKRYLNAREVKLKLANDPSCPERELEKNFDGTPVTWRRTFDKIVARYYALEHGKPWHVTKRRLKALKLYSEEVPWFPWKSSTERQHYHYKIGEWSRYVTPPNHFALPTDLPESEWTYDDGLLVYADAELDDYVVLDIEANTIAIIPFDTHNCVVRRLRLQERVLIFEWAESQPYHSINDTEEVHRHFVTAFDLECNELEFPWLSKWKITLRNEWKLHYLGFPLNQDDLWLSSHSKSYYAAYIWQQSRSAWGENEPIESLFIWDFSHASKYRPSEDPSGRRKPDGAPLIVKKLSYLDLDFLTLRQRDTPTLRRIEVDGSMCIYFFEDQCDYGSGRNVANYRWDQKMTNYEERVVAIPLLGQGPFWEDRRDNKSLAASDGDRNTPEGHTQPKRATCWRYEGVYPGFRKKVIQDKSTGIDFTIEHPKHDIHTPRVTCHSENSTTEIDLQGFGWQSSNVDGDERWLIVQATKEQVGEDTIQILRFDRDFKAQGRRLHLVNQPEPA